MPYFTTCEVIIRQSLHVLCHNYMATTVVLGNIIIKVK